MPETPKRRYTAGEMGQNIAQNERKRTWGKTTAAKISTPATRETKHTSEGPTGRRSGKETRTTKTGKRSRKWRIGSRSLEKRRAGKRIEGVRREEKGRREKREGDGRREKRREEERRKEERRERDQPIRIISALPEAKKPTTTTTGKKMPDTSRLQVPKPIRKKPTKRIRRQEEHVQQPVTKNRCIETIQKKTDTKTTEPKENKGKNRKRLDRTTEKRKRNTQRLEQGKQEMRTQTQQEMGKGEIQIQTIPPTEDNQPDTKQPK